MNKSRHFNNNKRRNDSFDSNSNKDGNDLKDTEGSKFESNDSSIEINPDYETDYQAYLRAYNSSTDHDEPPLSYEEFIAINYSDDLPQPQLLEDKLGFVIHPAVRRVGSEIFNASLNHFAAQTGTVQQAAKVLQAASQAMGPPGEGGIINVITSDPDGPSGRGGGSTGLPGHFNHTSLILRSRPVEERLNTGIETNSYFSIYEDAATYRSPLHLTLLKISFASVPTDDKAYLYFKDQVTSLFQNAASLAVSFKVDATTNFSVGNLLSYLDTVASALQIYYFFASVIMFESNPDNRNEGMQKLRALMTADDLDILTRLQKLLRGTPIPPRLNELIFYLSQTFRQGPYSGSSLMKIMPIGFADSADLTNYEFTSLKTGTIQTAIDGLNSSNSRKCIDLLARIAPDWRTDKIYTPFDRAVHDPQFTTIWTNLPGCNSGSGGTFLFHPSASADDANILYNSYTDDLDGAVYALTNIYNTTTMKWSPGFWDVDGVKASYYTGAARSTNRVSFYYDTYANKSGFFPAVKSTLLPWSRHETCSIGSVVSTYIRYAGINTLNVNMGSIRETFYDLLDWLISIDTIPIYSRNQSSNSKSSGSKSKSKGKSKFKNKSSVDVENESS